ncbi:3'(2'),5'-bisphosphate nucleotidase CysQ family protein [Bdellovibrio sp. BCCA]|uniref:3'(2'),5'-bisphosphate nucleotidase CysQ family protein n=1 Tax=Bdellovibrio sp. BCCA TaxID=3136281 RepID=UPI0030F0D697
MEVLHFTEIIDENSFNKLKEIIFEAARLANSAQSGLAVSIKSDGSRVTNGDVVVSEFLTKNLKRNFPDYDVFSEENCLEIPTKAKVFIIDPIDGTEEYLRGSTDWTIVIGLVHDKVPVGGLVYHPATDRLYFAFQNGGAFIQHGTVTKRIIIEPRRPIEAVLSKTDAGEREFLTLANIGNYQTMGSCSLKILSVAEGTFDIYPNFKQQCSWWDIVGPGVILSESGGFILFSKSIPLSFEIPKIPARLLVLGSRTESIMGSLSALFSSL